MGYSGRRNKNPLLRQLRTIKARPVPNALTPSECVLHHDMGSDDSHFNALIIGGEGGGGATEYSVMHNMCVNISSFLDGGIHDKIKP